jgi:hypothetical protein
MILAPAEAEKSINIAMDVKTMKKLLVTVCIVLLSVLSCDLFRDNGNFWAYDFVREEDYRITADLLASNALCEVWVERNSGVSAETAQAIANEYLIIYDRLMGWLGWVEIETGINVMQYADILGDGSGKLCILLLDIRDGYRGHGDAYIGGYFDPWNFFHAEGSNMRAMIYLDTYPSNVGSADFYGTLAHEMQHLMNFVTSIVIRSPVDQNGNITDIWVMDTWIDEGLSESAEWIYSAEQSRSRLRWYNSDSTGFLAMGDNFYMWDNYTRTDPMTVLNDYATVNFFFQWLRLQTYDDIYAEILVSQHRNFRAITDLVTYTWGQLLEGWHIANYVQAPTGFHGYKGTPVLKDIKAHFLAYNERLTYPLFPGEAVYTYSTSGIDFPNTQFIWYRSVYNPDPDRGHALITHNIDTNYSGGLKYGNITGELPPPPVTPTSGIRLARTYTLSENIQIGSLDMLRRLGRGQDFSNVRFSQGQLSRNAARKTLPFAGPDVELIRYRDFK